nr:MAG TPA: hypothetical protein [Caudoviricetes sp.]
MLPILKAVYETICHLLLISTEIYLCIRFFLGNHKDNRTLWYGIACILLLRI